MSTLSDTPSPGPYRPPPKRNHLKPCRLWLRGNCRFGDRCKFSHGEKPAGTNNDKSVIRWKPGEGFDRGSRKLDARTRNEGNTGNTKNPNENTDAQSTTLELEAKESGIESTIPKAPVKGIVCSYWKAGKCHWGARCRRRHDNDVQPGFSQSNAGISGAVDEVSQLGSTWTRRRAKQRDLAAAIGKRAEENRIRKEAAALAAERAKEENEKRLAQEKEAREAREAAARQAQLQLEARRKREASVTEQDLVLGSSLITYGAGLDIHSIITGFDLCRVTIKNLPPNARQEEIIHIFTQQGIKRSSLFIGECKDNGSRREATVLMKADEGQAIAIGLDGIEFRDHLLTFEVSGEVTGNTMGSSACNSDCLTVYWRVPSEAFIVTYLSMDEAQRKVSELDGKFCKGHRIRVQMNQPPPHGTAWRYYVESSIKITGFPVGTLPDHDLVSFSGSHQIRALTSRSCGLQDSHDILRRHLLPCRNIKIETYQNLTPKPVDGNVRVKVQFETWADAKSAYESINDKRLQYNSPIFHASLPNPLRYTIIIPKQQYEAQKKQWNSLSEKTPGSDAHVQTRIGDRGGVFIDVLGQDKKAVGSLKVRVEHMVAGQRLDPEFWHPSFLALHQKVFFDRVYKTKGVYVRSDPKTRSLKVYGGSDAMVEEARKMVKEEVDRLANLETTELLDQASVGFFVREGLGKLKELLGEENATMSFGRRGCHITIKGGEEGRRQLHLLIDESRTSGFVDQSLPGDVEKETCPICTDEISQPEQLGCGHAYCSGCLRHYLESASHTKNFPLACIGDEGACKIPIAIPQIRRFLQPQVFQALVEAAFRSYLDQHAQELKFCTTPDCQQIYRHSPDRSILQCPSCFSTICSACDEEAHEGMTCQERRLHKDPAEQDRLFNEWAAEKCKRCPECRSVIEKSEGCNHMTCRCGAHFCWRCGQTFSAATIYAHMNDAHGGMNDQIPVWANPDNAAGNILEEQARLLAQAQRQREIQADDAARVLRQQNALRVQMMEQRRRQQQVLEDAALQRQNALRAQMMEARRRQLQNDEDAALQVRRQNILRLVEERREEARATATQKHDDSGSGSWCVVM